MIDIKKNKFIKAYDEAMPCKDPGILLIKGSIVKELLEEYQCDDHDGEIDISFYVLQWGINYYDSDKKFPLENAVLYHFEVHCCSDDEVEKNHKIDPCDINWNNVKQFIQNKEDWSYQLCNIDEWIGIHVLEND